MKSPDDHYAGIEAEVLRWIADGGGDFGGMILRVFEFQRRVCPDYGAFCSTRPEPNRWRDIPAVPLSAFRKSGLRSFWVCRTLRTFTTSGTSGEGVGEHHFCSLSLYFQAVRRGWVGAGLPEGGIFALVPHASETPHSSLSQMAAWMAPPERFFFGRWEALIASLEGSARPVLFGTALAFLDFFEWMGDRRMDLPPGSTAVETGGYKGTRRDMPKEDLYTLFEKKLGLPSDSIWNEYGMTELSSQFYTHGLGRPHRCPPWARAVVVDPGTGLEVPEGETGLLRIFDTANLGSVSAIQTRDLAIRRGDGFELIGRDPSALPRGCSRTADEMLA